MTEETVNKAFALTSKIERAERALQQLYNIQERQQDEVFRTTPSFLSSISSALELIARDVDIADVINLLAEITNKHLINSREELAAL